MTAKNFHVLESRTVTASGNGNVNISDFIGSNRGIFFLDVSAASGTTPSLTVSVQVQDAASNKWQNIASFPAQTAATGVTPLSAITTELYGVAHRVAWTVSGTTPSFTFTLGYVGSRQNP